MYQGRFWGSRRWKTSDLLKKKRRTRKVELSERGIYEPVKLEEDFVQECIARLWGAGIPTFRERERIPICPSCHAPIGRPSDAGHPDMHGYIPARLLKNHDYPQPFYIEAKRNAKSVLRIAQAEFLKRAAADGILAFRAWNWAQVREAFGTLGVALP